MAEVISEPLGKQTAFRSDVISRTVAGVRSRAHRDRFLEHLQRYLRPPYLENASHDGAYDMLISLLYRNIYEIFAMFTAIDANYAFEFLT